MKPSLLTHMPAIGHIIVGLAFVIPWLLYSRNKFNYKVAFIFLINNYLGPDATLIFNPLVDLHNILGFALFAIPLSLMYSYASRFSLERSPHFVHLVDDGIREVSWKNAYLLAMAGCLTHFLIDFLFHVDLALPLFPGGVLTYSEIISWGGPAFEDFTPTAITGVLIVLVAILASFYCLKKGYKETFELLAVASTITLTIILVGTASYFGGEREMGAIFFALVFIFTPLSLIAWVGRDVKEHPCTQPDVVKVSRTSILKGISFLLICVSVLFLVVACVALSQPLFVVNLIGGEVFPNPTQGVQLVLTVAAIFAGVAGFLLVASIGLLFKKSWCRGIVVAFTTALIIAAAFPFAIALFLSEKDVKAMFTRDIPKPNPLLNP